MVTKDKNRPKLGMYVYQGQGQIGINVYDYGECQGRILGLWKSTLAYVLFDIAERVELKSAQTILASIYTPHSRAQNGHSTSQKGMSLRNNEDAKYQ